MTRFEVRIPYIMWATLEVVAESEEAAVKKAKEDHLWPENHLLGGLFGTGGHYPMEGVEVFVTPNDDPFDERLHIEAEVDDWGEE